MSSTAISAPNIALIKYWGNRNNAFRLPAADSLSMTLDSPLARVTVDHSDMPKIRSYKPDGIERAIDMGTMKRFGEVIELSKQYLADLGARDAIPASLSVDIRSEVPPGVGIASSAAIFCALAEAIAGLVKEKKSLTRTEVSVLARLGSGSAARSVFGGYSALAAGKGDGIDSAYAEQIAEEDHWVLHDIIIVPDQEEKKVGSTEGHAMAHTSSLFAERIKAIPRRMQECIDAIRMKDFGKLQRVSEEDSLDMHKVMETQIPSLKYLSHETWRIIRDIEALRSSKNLPVLYTMDAGPTVHLICAEEALSEVLEYANVQEKCLVFQTRTGSGSRVE